MGTNTIRLDDDVYERLKSKKRDDETFSEAVNRLIGEWTLLDFAAEDTSVDPGTHRELLEEIDKRDIEEATERLERAGINIEE
ncbi:MAG: antitoxin VapB family protein [Haloarculaceae archaeon]